MKTKLEVEQKLQEIRESEYYKRKKEKIEINPYVAIIQIGLASQEEILRWVLGENNE